jgi:hypothetical protein
MGPRRLFTVACAVCVAALGGGCFLAVFWGGAVPDWLLRAELAALCSVALVYGFTASLPTLAPLLWSRPVQGATLVVLGVAAIFVPVQWVAAALLIGIGTRRIWVAACQLVEEEEASPPVTTVEVAGREIVRRNGRATWTMQPRTRKD